MKNYELLYLVSGQITENEIKPIQEKIIKSIETEGGIIGRQEFLGKRKLSYPIKKTIHGYYFAVEFELAETSKLKSISKKLEFENEIIRFQIIIKSKFQEKTAPKKPAQETEQAFSPLNPEFQKTPADEKPPSRRKAPSKDLDQKLDEILKKDEIL